MCGMKTERKFAFIFGRFVLVCLGLMVVMVSGCSESKKASQGNAKVAYQQELDEPLENDFELFEEEYSQKAVTVEDPMEEFNRLMFDINDTLYFVVLKPVTDGYVWIVPKDVRTGVGNFFQNLGTPARFVNCHLQGNVEKADIELSRFLINTTYGIAGIWDPALEEHGLEAPSPEDLGQTLAVWGYEDGCYLVLPLLGPSTLRDGVGQVGDIFMNPLFYVNPREAAYIAGGTKYINISSLHQGEYENFKEDSVDPYVAMRDIYLQYRKKKIEE